MTRIAALIALAGALVALPVSAQTPPAPADSDSGERVVIDILAPAPAKEAPSAAALKACEEERAAGQLSQEIIVCGDLGGDPDNWYSGGREAWLKRYAERSRNINTIPAPDVAGEGIFRGPPSIGGLCVIPPCPDPPALLIDVEALPPPPEGSDADRIARGLPPVGNEGEPQPDPIAISEEQLGLPAPPDFGPEQ
jgi:hypothetical protein